MEQRTRRACVVCGADFTPARSDAQSCSKACKIRRDAARRKAKDFRDAAGTEVCDVCASAFNLPGVANGKFCSSRCEKAHDNAKRYGGTARPRIEAYDCATCGKRCVPGENVGPAGSKFCSRQCKRQWHSPDPTKYKPLGPLAERRKHSKPKPGPATLLAWVKCATCKNAVVINPRVGRPLGGWRREKGGWHCPKCPWWPDNQTNIWTAGRCRRCGDPFAARNGRTPAYCSFRCARLAAKDARRTKVGDISRPRRYAIFERDDWQCKLCGRLTKKDQWQNWDGRTYMPDAPTIDHILPVSKGGTNDEANLQTAHWSCNSAKSDGVLKPEQLRLLAA